ncbi:TetR/AcrR family transcriptional regulator [Flavihumibacter profundi]|jgi:AcrR family transcriptional regulator|uniref:TetR/AcrR family transcriptional regulator n=1 Tax=Flavihumibacter profundi TaxID=2716883 RepID=UPI001CC40232|nr:TetR/AcrR family transcriptional regulator [Flavihumibacter profundi]MBZ5856765.1 TetR/AcrR family transcriptional regulator [Flavihumibacter profundi]
MKENLPQDLHYSEKQVAILLATEQLIAEKGYSASSVRDIAQAAGVNVAMISYYFGSKEKLLEALFVYRIDSSRVVLQALLENTVLNPFEKLEILVTSYVDKLINNFAFYQIMNREPAIKEIKNISKIVNATKQRNQGMIRQLIDEGQSKNFFKNTVDVSLLMHTMMGTLMSVCNNADYLKIIYQSEHLSEEEFGNMMRERLKVHLFQMMKAALTQPIT